MLGMPDTSRRTSASSERTFHLGFGEPDSGSSAARADRYGSDKAAIIAAAAEVAVGEERGAAIADGYAAGHGGEDQTQPLVFTNLEADSAARAPQWDEIEEAERSHGLTSKPAVEKGLDRINVRPRSAPALVAAIADDPACPASLRAMIATEEGPLETGVHRGARRETLGAAYVAEDAADIHAWIRSTIAWRDASAAERKAFTLSKGRNRQSYVAFDCELPSMFDTEACIAVASGVAGLYREHARRTRC